MTTLSAPALWFSEDGGLFHGNEPFYYNPADYPWVRHIEDNWTTIRDELKALTAQDTASLTPYANMAMTTKPNQWKTFGLMFWLNEVKEHTARCPKTWALLKQIPHLSSASFNLLEPHTTIKPHHGDTNAVIRCHLGIDVPAPAPKCAFRVGDDIRSWEDGKMLMFCDAHEHTAWNNSDQQRYILVLDVLRPELSAGKRWTAARVLASISMAICYQRAAWMRKFLGHRVGKSLVFRSLQLAILTRSLLA
ncbi:aspartyl/asparaginyl beta-hydroxylase domain-containing protein [Oxalobacteraceae bacterium OTU3REALA1]|nr:aspartyl/asparaginyl beta-hydroxylase domain-containing protein [Oxalobacteraceae bacterium OTU3REALA1]